MEKAGINLKFSLYPATEKSLSKARRKEQGKIVKATFYF